MQVSGWLTSEISSVIGWTIIHSVWQSLLLLIILKALLLVVGKKRSGVGYLISLSVLSMMLFITFFTIKHEFNSFNANDVSSVNPAMIYGNSHLSERVIAETTSGIPAGVKDSNLYSYLTRLSPYLTLGWMLGMLLYTGRLLYSGYYLKRLRREPSCDDPEVIKTFRALCVKMDINRSISLIITAKVYQPMTFGFFKAVIVLPFHYVTQAPADQLEMILAHELSHIKRWDYLVNICQSVLEAIYFFNPFFRSLSDTVRDEREYCCDDMATEICGDKRTMAIALTQLRILTNHARLSLSASPVKKAFYERVYRLVNPSSNSSLSVKSSLLALCMTAGIIILLAQCTMNNNASITLLQETDTVKQLWEDNQAGHKIQLLGFGRSGQEHEILLVSTIEGKPIYAYVDGAIVQNNQVGRIYNLLSHKKNVSEAELSNAHNDQAMTRMEKNLQLQREMDSIDNQIKTIESGSVAGNVGGTGTNLASLKNKLLQKTEETKALSMAQYNEDARKIPVDVQLHELVTRIIDQKEYTPTERKQLNQLIRQKQSI